MPVVILINAIALAITCAVIGYVYTVVLTEPGQILSWWYKMWDRVLHPHFDFLFKPIIGCEMCFTGQFALWTFAYLYKSEYRDTPLFSIQFWTLLYIHVFAVMFAILCVKIIQKLLK